MFKCKECGRGFKTKGGLKHHQTVSHGDEQTDAVPVIISEGSVIAAKEVEIMKLKRVIMLLLEL